MGLSLYDIKRIVNPKKTIASSNDFKMLDSWTIFNETSGKNVNERPLEYLCYELETINPETGETYHYYKALKFARVIRLPKSAKQSTSFMDMHSQVLSAVYESGINLVTIIANIFEPVPLGLLYLYGVQGVAHTIEEAKEKAKQSYLGFTAAMQGTYRVLEMRTINAQETEWLREKMYNMDYMTVIRGIPKANQGGEDAGNKGMGGRNLNPDSQGTLEELITGMADYEYVIQILSTPVFTRTLRAWQRQTEKEMTDWHGQVQGTKSFSMNLSMPMMFMANQTASTGWNKAYTDAESVNFSTGESFNTNYGENVGESLSNTFGNSYTQSRGLTVTDSVTQSHGVSQGTSVGHTVGSSVGQSFGQTVGRSFGTSFSTNVGQNIGHSTGESFGQNIGQSFGENIGKNIGQNIGESIGQSYGQNSGQSISENIGQSVGQNIGISQNQGVSVGQSQSLGQSLTEGYSQGISQNIGLSKGQNFSQSLGQSVGSSMNMSQGQNQSISHSLGQNEGVSVNSSENWGTNESASIGQSASSSIGNSMSTSHGVTASDSWSRGENHGSSFSRGHSENESSSWGINAGDAENINTGGSIGIMGTGGNVSKGDNNSLGASIGGSSGSSDNWGYSRNDGYSFSESGSLGRSDSFSSGVTSSSSLSNSSTLSAGQSHGVGISQGSNFGVSENWGNTQGISLSESWGVNQSTNQSQSVGQSEGINIGQGINESNSMSKGLSLNQGLTTGYNQSAGISQGQSIGFNQGQGVSLSQGESVGINAGQSRGFSEGMSIGQSIGQNIGQSLGKNVGTSIGQSVGYSQGVNQSESVSYNQGVNYSRSVSDSVTQSVSESYSVSQGKSVGHSDSESVGQSVSRGESQSFGKSTSMGQGQSFSEGRGSSQSISTGTSGNIASGISSSMGLGPSLGYNKSYQWLDQQVKDIIELLEFQNERIKKALRGQGAFYTYVYIACPTQDALSAAMAAAKATWQNEYAMTNPIQVLNLSTEEQKKLLYHFSAFSSDISKEVVYGVEEYKYTTILLPNEFVAYTHLPRVSEGGVFAEVNDVPKFSVPSMLKGEIYMGTILSAERYTMNNGYKTPYDYRINEAELMHGFFTGASRSGKTVAAMRFIAELAQIKRKKTGKRMRIVCMDPKQDWRTLARFVEPERFNFYSLGNANFRPLKLNPLKIPRGVEPQFWIDGLIDIYCRAYGLLERGKQMMGETIYQLYEEAGVFTARNEENWKDLVSERSKEVTFAGVYERMSKIKASLEDPTNPKGRAGNDTRDAYARLLDRLQAFNREFSIERKLFGTREGIGIDELIGDDDVTVLESKGLENTFRNFLFGIITSGFYKYAIAHEGGYLAEDQYETLLVIEEANEVLTGNDAAGTGGGSGSGLTVAGQSEFEQILDQSAGYGLFIMAITQKIADMPASIIANSGLVFAGKLKRPDDVTTVVRSIAREDRYEDRDLVKWFPRSPIGWFVCQSSRGFDFKDAEPILVQIAPLNISPPSNQEIDELMKQKEALIAINKIDQKLA